MRQARLKARTDQPVAYYHCLSRVVDRRFLFGDQEREKFLHYLRLYAQFCGVRILTYCILSNHFHLLIEVPRRPEVLPSDEELLGKLRVLYGPQTVQAVREQLEKLPAAEAAALRERYFRRMWDLSQFMKTLKQRFSQWYNRKHERQGTLWEERFKSVLVDSAGLTLATMTAYIDLNPVRAGLVADPKDYRWCGYAAAVAGQVGSGTGYQTVMTALRGQELGPKEALETYRMWLFGQGSVEGVNGPGEPTVRLGIDRERVEAVLARKGKLSLGEYVRCRVRYFVDGAVLGSKEFVEEVFVANRGRFGPRRKDGARKLRYLADATLYCLRDLKINPVG